MVCFETVAHHRVEGGIEGVFREEARYYPFVQVEEDCHASQVVEDVVCLGDPGEAQTDYQTDLF